LNQLIYNYNDDKNTKLKQERGISFEEIVFFITNDRLIDTLDHPDQQKYPGQKIFVLDIDNYVWLVPYVKNDREIFLKTAFPSRKHSKKYLEEKNAKKFTKL
jgi:uncharacterized DUF497 family protein